MAKNKHPKSYDLARASQSAKTILKSLGVESRLLPGNDALDDATIIREEIVLPVGPGRFRRTNQEIAEHEALNAWQLKRRDQDYRNLAPFVINL